MCTSISRSVHQHICNKDNSNLKSSKHPIISSLIDIPNNNLKLQIIAYDRRRGGTIVIDKRPGGRTVTSLIISQADVRDSGNYTCDPASNYSKWVIVHVTTGLYLVGYT